MNLFHAAGIHKSKLNGSHVRISRREQYRPTEWAVVGLRLCCRKTYFGLLFYSDFNAYFCFDWSHAANLMRLRSDDTIISELGHAGAKPAYSDVTSIFSPIRYFHRWPTFRPNYSYIFFLHLSLTQLMLLHWLDLGWRP
jgi:hypothetical protein